MVKNSEKLEKILDSSENKEGVLAERKEKLGLVLLSELQLATRLSDPQVLYEVGERIKEHPGRIDAVVINGGLGYVPNKFSKRRTERLDLLEDRLKERYGREVYKEVKQGASDTDSIDSLEEAARLARVQMHNIYKQASAKGAKIYYVFSESDYKNVEVLISAIEKIRKQIGRQMDKDNARYDDLDFGGLKGVEPELLDFIKQSYKAKASEWKNKDKEGIKDVALQIYRKWVNSIFSENGKDADSDALVVLKRLENDVEINGLNVRISHSIDGLTFGNSEGKPTESGTLRAIDRANQDAMQGRLADIYLRAHESKTHVTAVDYRAYGHEKPVYLINSGPLQDLDTLIRLRASWNKTTETKRLEQGVDSAMTIFTLYKDAAYDSRHISLGALQAKTKVSKLEENLDKNMYEFTEASDFHVGAANPDGRTNIEMIEAMLLEIKRSKVPRQRRHIAFEGDMLHAAGDKYQRTDIAWSAGGNYDDLLKEMEKAKTPEEKEEFFRNSIYGRAILDMGAQAEQLAGYYVEFAKAYGHAHFIPGNHVQTAASNASEGGFMAGTFKAVGTLLQPPEETEIVHPDKLALKGKNPHLGPYTLSEKHSPGYRTAMDAGTAIAKQAVKVGDNIDMAVAGDCHEEHEVYQAKKVGEKWMVLRAHTSASAQLRTSFEKTILAKPYYTKGFSTTYLPVDPEIGTSYIIHSFVPEYALQKLLKENGGSKLEKIVKSRYS